MVDIILPIYHPPLMALNIKNEEAHRMAKELAEAHGITLTEAVTSALSASLESLPGSPPEVLLQEIAEIQRFVADLPDLDTRTADEILGYDRHGLPD
jgi:antitoxin VapB